MPDSELTLPRLLVVAGLIRGRQGSEHESEFLVSRRRKGGHLAEWWEFPGGKVEPGEPPPKALARELKEELGVEVDVEDVFGVGHHVYAEKEVVLLVYEARVRSGEPACLEVMDFRWVSPQALCEMTLPPADEPILARLRKTYGLPP